MTPDLWKPSHYAALLRDTIRDLIRPHRPVTEASVARIVAEINTVYEIAREYEDEHLVLESLLMPAPVKLDFVDEPARIIPIRRRPELRLVTGGRGGGDAA